MGNFKSAALLSHKMKQPTSVGEEARGQDGKNLTRGQKGPCNEKCHIFGSKLTRICNQQPSTVMYPQRSLLRILGPMI